MPGTVLRHSRGLFHLTLNDISEVSVTQDCGSEKNPCDTCGSGLSWDSQVLMRSSLCSASNCKLLTGTLILRFHICNILPLSWMI